MKGWSSIFILLLVGVLAYILYTKLQGLHFGDGSGGSGSFPNGGNAGNPGDQDGKSGSAVNITNEAGDSKKPVALIKRPKVLEPAHQVLTLPDLLKPVLGSIFTRLPDPKLGYTPQIQQLGKGLAQANKEAKKFVKNFGTTPNINKALAAVKYISDDDFTKVIVTWQAIDHFKSPLDTDLCGANISNGERSDFLGRINKLNLI